MKSILKIEVSCFANYDTPANPKNVNLLAWLQSDKYRDKVESIRAIEDKAARDELKATLPAITASGVFSYRDKKYLLKYSGFIAIDIDLKGNERIGNFTELKNHLCNIPNVAYCGLSVSGRGYWCLIPIAYPGKHEEHFQALQEAFKSLGITIDKACKDVSRLRGYSYDKEGYFNHFAQLFHKYKMPEKKIIPIKRLIKKGNNSQEKISIAVKMIHHAPDGEKHNTLLKAAILMGGYIVTGEVDEVLAINEMENAIQSRAIGSFDEARKTIKKGIEYGKNRPVSCVYGSFQQPEQPKPPQPEIEQLQPISINTFKDVFIPAQTMNPLEPETKVLNITGTPEPEHWQPEIAELGNYFNTATLPTGELKLNAWSTINNVSKFINSNLTGAKNYKGNKRLCLSYLDPLRELKQYLTAQS